MKPTLRLLATAYVYPPDAGSGTFRTLHFLNRLSQGGIRISVLTAKVEHFHPAATIDPPLLNHVDSNINVIRCSVARPLEHLARLRDHITIGENPASTAHTDCKHPVTPDTTAREPRISQLLRAPKTILSNLLACPDPNVGWIPYALKQGLTLCKNHTIDALFATGGPWCSVLVGALLNEFTDIPLILDFQDPWASNPNLHKKPPVIRRIEQAMESFAIKHARVVVANTEESRADFLARYDFLSPDNTHAITNGFEPHISTIHMQRQSHFSLVHTGELYLSRNPVNLLEAFETLITRGTINPARVRLSFIGGMSIIDPKLTALLRSPILAEVLILRGRVPHAAALQIQQSADALLLIQPDLPLQIPGKLYEYLSFRKPILAISEASGATANLIRRCHLGTVVENRTSDLIQAVQDLYDSWNNNALQSAPTDITQFTYQSLTRRLELIIRRVITTPQ